MLMLETAAPADPRMRREWVKYHLRLRGTSFAQIGRDLGVTRWAVHRAFLVPYPRVERAIADRLGCEPRDIWPERYDPEGHRLRQKPGPKPGPKRKIRVSKDTSGR